MSVQCVTKHNKFTGNLNIYVNPYCKIVVHVRNVSFKQKLFGCTSGNNGILFCAKGMHP